MSYHAKIMNLRCIGWNELYKEGHRDARHAAAEIALEAEQEIERLTSAPPKFHYTMPETQAVRLLQVRAKELEEEIEWMREELMKNLQAQARAALNEEAKE